VFIDLSFVEVLLDPSDDRHRVASNEFDRLLVEFELGSTLLFSQAELGLRSVTVGRRRSCGCARSPGSAAGSPERQRVWTGATPGSDHIGQRRWC